MTALRDSFAHLASLDPGADLADLEPLAEIVGDARVVAIGESTHYAREFYLLRHRLARFLVERLGFDAIAWESGFPEAWQVDAWVAGGQGEVAGVAETGMTYMFGRCAEMRDLLSWLRSVNAGREHPVRFYGIDLPASCGSLRPALRAIEPFLAAADPALLPRLARLRSLAETVAESEPATDQQARAALRAYGALPRASRDELTGGLADLAARFDAARLDYIERAGQERYAIARQQLRIAVQLDAWIRDYTAAAAGEHAFFDVNIRDAGMAQTTEWILERAGKLVIMAHNLHIQRTPYALSWLGTGEEPTSASSLGCHLHARFGAGYLVVGTTFGGGEVIGVEGGDAAGWDVKDVVRRIEPPGPVVVDGLFDTVLSGPAVVDLRGLGAGARRELEPAGKMHCLDQVIDVPVLDAFDALVHVPRISLWRSEATAVLLGE
jgi:erythromycin esterase